MVETANISDLIVVRVDGGICSQVDFVSLGLHLQQKFGDAVRVRYDLSWFRDCGMDVDGRFVRNWDFPKAFPGLQVEEATAEEIAALKAVRQHVERTYEDICAPMYVGGYPSRIECRLEQLAILRKSFRPELSPQSLKLLDGLRSSPWCAVHVRRGDLSGYIPGYGRAASVNYFVTAVRIVRLALPSAKFCFFSDEPSYVHREILPALPPEGEYVVSDANGSDRGYEDLCLIAQADAVITSAGTLGRLGATLSERCRLVVGLRRPGQARVYSCEAIFLDDVHVEPLPPTGRCGLSFVQYLWRRLKLRRRQHRRFISLGWNCELAFRYYKRNGFMESNLFAWGTTSSVSVLTAALRNWDGLFTGDVEGPNPLYECANTHLRLHGKGGLPVAEEKADLIARVAHLKRKFGGWLSESDGVLVMYKMRTEEWFEPDAAERLRELHRAVAERGSGKFTLVIVCEEKCRERPLSLGLPDCEVRYVSAFNPRREVTNEDIGDKWGWRLIFDEFVPAKRLPKKHDFKFE